MKKILFTLTMGLCLSSYSHAQLRDSSMKKNPRGTNRPMQDSSLNKNRNDNNTKNRNYSATDSSMNQGITPGTRKNNAPNPSTNKPQ